MMDTRHKPSGRQHLPTANAVTASLAAERLVITVGGLTCASDAVRLEAAIRREPGVVDVVVNPITQTAYVTIDRGRATPEAIRCRIDASPYGPAAR
jgi:copper chaperone CopZ